jgi:hypothetical protein
MGSNSLKSGTWTRHQPTSGSSSWPAGYVEGSPQSSTTRARNTGSDKSPSATDGEPHELALLVELLERLHAEADTAIW